MTVSTHQQRAVASQSAAGFVQTHGPLVRKLPLDREFLAKEMLKPSEIQGLVEHDVVEKVDSVSNVNGNDRLHVWRVTEEAKKHIRNHQQPTLGAPAMPCSAPSEGHYGFENLGKLKGETLLECKQCGAKWFKSEVTQ